MANLTKWGQITQIVSTQNGNSLILAVGIPCGRASHTPSAVTSPYGLAHHLNSFQNLITVASSHLRCSDIFKCVLESAQALSKTHLLRRRVLPVAKCDNYLILKPKNLALVDKLSDIIVSMSLNKRNTLNQLTERELEEALYRKRYLKRKNRLTRLKSEGRVVDTQIPENRNEDQILLSDTAAVPTVRTNGRWGWLFNRSLLLIEVTAALGFIWIVFSLIGSLQQLNSDIKEVQQSAISNVAGIASPTLPPVIDLVLLPTGHKPPIEGQPIIYEEAGGIPDHLLPLVDAYVPPISPTPAPEQPRQIEIAKIGVNAPVFQGHEEEQLKKGVGHSIGTAVAGSLGNMVLSAHNDIYGEIFRNLDQLEAGDDVIVSSGRESYTYVINSIEVVEPTAVEVMAPTDHASLTLISCYPYLIDNKRIIVKADLKETLENG